MKVLVLFLGKTSEKYLSEGISNYINRLIHYTSLEVMVLPDVKNAKNLSVKLQKGKEGETILKNIGKGDYVILLDERGKLLGSKEFSVFVQQKLLVGIKRIVFVIGGAYGFSDELYQRANIQLSLSKMTFSHQMVRLIFLEQLYRAFTIIKGEPYHHD